MSYYNSQLTTANSILIDGYQIAIQSDRSNQLAKRVSNRQFALPVQENEEYFWILARSMSGDACLYVGLNGILSQSSWVLDEGRELRFDHQPGGDKGRFCVMPRQGNEQMVSEYASVGITGPLAQIELEFHKLQPEYRSQTRSMYKGIDDVLRGSRGSYDVGGTFGGATRGGNFESTRGSKGFDYEEAIIATGGESSMNTRKVQREEDESAPIIRISIEIVAAGSSNVRIPNPNQAPRSTFMW